MGLIDFVKEAGESLLGKSRAADGDAVSKRIQDLGLSVDGLKVEVDGDKAILRGKAASQAEREKAIQVDKHSQTLRLTGFLRPEDVPPTNVVESWPGPKPSAASTRHGSASCSQWRCRSRRS